MNNYKGKNVLLVDDDKLILTILERILKKYKLTIDRCGNTPELLDVLKRKTYDLVFLDHMMPIISGTEAMHQLKTAGYSKPIVVVTSNEGDEFKNRYLSLGFDDYLSKPLDIEELERVLEKFLK